MKLDFIILKKNKRVENHELDVYMDDTIENIKYKLSQLMDNKNIKEYYFFYKKKVVLNPYEVYKQLSKNDTVLIDNKKLKIFFMNHDFLIEEKEYYSLDDILEIDLSRIQYVNEPIGIENNFFIVNPFDNDLMYQENISTTSNNLLLDYPDATEIFVCLAKDVYKYSQKKRLNINKIANVYYPYLFEEGKFSSDNFVIETMDEYDEYNKMIDFHHSIYNKTKDTYKNASGIDSLYFVLYTKEPFNFPIDIFFKLIQSDQEYPFIKLNPGKKQENIFRLYSPNISLTGNKAPYFDKSKINKFRNIIKKNDIVSFVIEYEDINIIIDIDKNGYIYYNVMNLRLVSIEGVEHIITDTLNPLINRLIQYFDPSEKIFNTFTHLQTTEIDLIDM